MVALFKDSNAEKANFYKFSLGQKVKLLRASGVNCLAHSKGLECVIAKRYSLNGKIACYCVKHDKRIVLDRFLETELEAV